jgi:ubiquinone/menaquinone biosynthesis C-methylase UbiE
MPDSKADGLVVVDYGCGPGNDLVGFSVFSKTKMLFGVDVSFTALDLARNRLKLHSQQCTLLHISETDNVIPIDSASVDLVHSSGVLHHIENLSAALVEIHRVLKVGGKFQTMVYNYDSLWLHLYTAYVYQIERKTYSDLTVLDAARHLTDGPHCPVSNFYRPDQFTKIVCDEGFKGGLTGSSISLMELKLLPKRFDAIESIKLPIEHRNFLMNLQFDSKGLPTHNGIVAGIGACFEFTKIG